MNTTWMTIIITRPEPCVRENIAMAKVKQTWETLLKATTIEERDQNSVRAQLHWNKKLKSF